MALSSETMRLPAMAPPVSVVQPGQTGAITSGTSNAVNPRLNQDKAKPATHDKPTAPK